MKSELEVLFPDQEVKDGENQVFVTVRPCKFKDSVMVAQIFSGYLAREDFTIEEIKADPSGFCLMVFGAMNEAGQLLADQFIKACTNEADFKKIQDCEDPALSWLAIGRALEANLRFLQLRVKPAVGFLKSAQDKTAKKAEQAAQDKEASTAQAE